MNRNKSVKQLSIAGLLTAIAIMIPTMMPIKLILGPSTYTLASHVPVFIAMFISPQVAIMVALGSTVGFLMSFPFIVAARAFSHLAFVVPGALFLKKHKLTSKREKLFFNIIIALIHGLAEFTVVLLLSVQNINMALIIQFILFLGIGTMIHSIVDFILAIAVVDGLQVQKEILA